MYLARELIMGERCLGTSPSHCPSANFPMASGVDCQSHVNRFLGGRVDSIDGRTLRY